LKKKKKKPKKNGGGHNSKVYPVPLLGETISEKGERNGSSPEEKKELNKVSGGCGRTEGLGKWAKKWKKTGPHGGTEARVGAEANQKNLKALFEGEHGS